LSIIAQFLLRPKEIPKLFTLNRMPLNPPGRGRRPTWRRSGPKSPDRSAVPRYASRSQATGDQRTGKIFLSYRRKGSAAGFALALFNRLELTFPPENLFGGIKAGQDFVLVLEREVSAVT
jgi:hypothetical protein